MSEKIIFFILIFVIFIAGCARDVTKEEAENIAKEYIISKNLTDARSPLQISNTFLQNDEWHIQLIVGDDKGTIILSKKGKVLKAEDKWI